MLLETSLVQNSKLLKGFELNVCPGKENGKNIYINMQAIDIFIFTFYYHYFWEGQWVRAQHIFIFIV